jgi:peroxin-13
MYGSGYSGYSGYSSYSGCGGYGGVAGGGMGGYGWDDLAMVRQAEERTRSTFQSVETVVGAFASVTMMLESTYFAVQSCFRALLGVAQHFTQLRNYMWGLLGALAVLRRLRYWLKRLLRWLHLRNMAPPEELWEEASLESVTSSTGSPTSWLWPLVKFLSVLFGVPWLLWRTLSFLLRNDDSSTGTRNWSSNEGQPLVARALHDFSAVNSDELSVSAGDELVLAPRQLQTGWLLVGKNRTSGLVPANYVQIVHQRPPSVGGVSSEDLPPSQSTPTTTTTATRQRLADEESLLTD